MILPFLNMECQIEEQECDSKMGPHIFPDHLPVTAEAVSFDALCDPARKEPDSPCAQTDKP